MLRIKSFLFATLLSVGMLLTALTVFAPHPVSAAYDGASLTDNVVFLRSNSLSAADIQSFLVSKGGGIANMSFPLTCYGSSSREWQLYTAAGAPCGQTIPASQIIYYASQVYGLNPQVILATLQKEQSLITTPNPDSWQINQAMGYGCPTTGSCSDSSNFFYQIDSGTWVLRYHYERANGNNSWWNQSTSWVCGTEKNFYKPGLWPGTNVTFYDGNGVAYRTYTIANAATAALYCYTPHAYNNPAGLYGREPFGTTGQYYSGSYNFVYYFERWFGSTHGELIGLQGGGVYKMENGVKRAFPNEITFLSYSYKWSNVTLIGSTQLSQIPDGANMTYNTHYRDGHLVSSPSGGMYIVENGLKRPFPNEETFYSYSFKWSDALAISSAELNLIPDGSVMAYNTHYRDGRLVRISNGGVYYVENGLKRPFPNEETFYSYSYKWSDVLTITPAEISLIPDGSVMAYNTHYRDGRLVRISNGGVYYVENGLKRPFPNEETFYSYSYKWSDVLTITPAEISLIPDGSVMAKKT